MEFHMETSGYLACGDTNYIGAAVRELFESEGMRVIDKQPFVIQDAPALQCNYWSVAIIPGVPGWHLLLTSPRDLLCERTRDGASRFVALCEALKVPGILRQVNEGDEDLEEMGRVTLEADGIGRVALCGCILREAEGFEQKETMYWNGYEIPQENLEMQTVFIHNYLPSDASADEEDFYSNISEERHSRAYARRIVGPDALACWEGGMAWHILTMALALGKPFPIAGALALTFEWPPVDRPSPDPRRPTDEVCWSPWVGFESAPQVVDGSHFDAGVSRQENPAADLKANPWWKRIFS